MTTVDSSSTRASVATFPASTYKKLLPLDFLRLHLARNVRPSSRSLHESRPVVVSYINLSSTTFGSVVRLGATSLVCSITAELCEPSVEKPGDGYIVPNVVLSPLSNPKHKPGPPSDQAQSLSAQIYSLILALSPNLPSVLCIERGKCAWTLYIDIQFLNYDGNAFDSAWLAVSCALSRIQLPPIDFNADLNRGVLVDGVPAKLPFEGENVFACAFVGIDEGKYVLFDPDQDEEELATERVTVVVDGEGRLRYLYKSGIGLGREDIKRCIELAGERAGYLSFVLEQSANKIQTSE